MIKIIQSIVKLVFVFIILSITTSCAYFKLKTLDSYEYNDVDIYTLLSKEYKKFAKSELYEMHDEFDANYFAYKALIAKNEKKIYLENPNDLNIPNHAFDEAINYYKKITKIINKNIEKHPTQVSLMISGYDCWLEQLEENWQLEDIKKCKLRFINNYNQILHFLDKNNNSVNKEKTVVSKIKKVSSKAKNNEDDLKSKEKIKVTVYFNYDSFNLTNKELNKLNKVITTANKSKNQSIVILGHTDTRGSDNYNLILSNKRASFIKKYLQSKKIINNITTKGLGETSPIVDTGDNKLEEKNRRAQIIFN